MDDSAVASSAPSASNDSPAPPQSAGAQNSDARPQNRPSNLQAKGNLEQFAKNVAKNGTPKAEADTKAPQQQDDDPEFDFDGEKYKRSQLAEMAKKRREYDRAASQRMEEAANIRKQVAAQQQQLAQVLQQLQQNPWALHEHLGLNPDELAEQRLSRSLERSKMSPEAIELEKARAELQRVQQEAEQTKKTQQQQAHEAKVNHWKQFFDKAIGTALDQGSLPRTAHTAQRMRQALSDLVDAGHQIDDTAVAMAVDIARERATTETQGLLGDLAKSNPRALVEMLGGLDGDIVKAIQRQAVARHEGTQRPAPAKPRIVKPQTPKGPPTLEEVRKQLGMG